MSKFAILEYLNRPQLVMIDVPLKGGGKRRFSSIAKLIDQDQRFMASIKNEYLPPDQELDQQEKCLVTLDSDGHFFSTYAKILEITSREKLVLQAVDFVSYKSKRNAFRVSATLPVTYKHFYREDELPKAAESINISSKGILLMDGQGLKKGDYLSITIEIPSPKPKTVSCTANVVRIQVKPDNTQETALQFLDLDEKTEDAIMGFCFEQQRQRMKEKVQVADLG